ncbi:MAG: hypothetical protein AB7P04_10965 [Bacteriovoracia bacterium]
MKLKLEEKQGMKVLQVLEGVSPQDAAVLCAGVTKILQSSVPVLIVNLAAVSQIDAESLQKIRGLKDTAATMSARLILVSAAAGIGDAPTEEAALTLAASPVAGLLEDEARWKARLETATKLKAELEAKIQAMSAAAEGLQKARKENSTLKRAIRELEQEISQLRTQRTAEPFTGASPLDAKRTELDGILNKVLQDLKWVP